MTIDEAIARERQQAKEQRNHIGTWDDEYSKKCEVYAEEHEQLAEWLEELKAIKEMDLSIPQHFTKEQSDWIKTYCIKRNIEFYNKAIDDMLKMTESMEFRQGCIQSSLPLYEYIEIKAQQLKVGGTSGTN